MVPRRALEGSTVKVKCTVSVDTFMSSKLVAALLVGVLIAGVVVAYIGQDNNSNQASEEEGDGNLNAFTWDLFDSLGDGNIVFSPYGLYTAFGMLANGAKDGSATQKEVLDALYSSSDMTLNAYIKELQKLPLTETADGGDGPKLTFESNNLILVDSAALEKDGVKINAYFRSIIEGYYNGAISEADFHKNLDAAKEYIKSWVNETTHGMIPDYESEATPATITDILNVVYFKADWRYLFDPANTYKTDFNCSDGSKGTVEMMHRSFSNSIRYYENDRYMGLEIPYASGDNYAMYIVLPKDHGVTMLDMWKNESVEYREAFMENIRNAPFANKVILSLPSMDMDVRYDIEDILTALGVTVSFSDDAQYTEMVDGMCLRIDGGCHQVRFIVDEEGTEAAAVTEIVTKNTTSMPDKDPIVFNCNIPFIFTVSEMSSGTNIFAGYYGHA